MLIWSYSKYILLKISLKDNSFDFFLVNGADAGSGNLEILVNGGHVTSNVKSLGNHCFLASFIPHTATTHTIEMKFNGHPVPGNYNSEFTEYKYISVLEFDFLP